MTESRLILIILCLFGLGGCYYVAKHPFYQSNKNTPQNVQNWTPSPMPDAPKVVPPPITPPKEKKQFCPNDGCKIQYNVRR